jgi:spheroidene monooxygenase
MQVTTLSFFRFRGFWSRLWAFAHMQLGKRPLRQTEDIGFHRLMGTGSGEGFDPAPNFSVYAILATWPSLEIARERVDDSPIYRRYRRRADESWTVFVAPTRSRGSWDGHRPFQPEDPPQDAGGDWVGVLTRATVRTSSLLAFWRTVPPISALTAGLPGLHFKLGMGELPVMQLMTFSLWRDLPDVKRFAYGAGPHREAMQLARKHRWFEEELFARFRVIDAVGTWHGTNPLEKAREEEVAA